MLKICPTSYYIDEYVNKTESPDLLEACDLADLVMEGKRLKWCDLEYPARWIGIGNCIDYADVVAITHNHYAKGFNSEDLGMAINEGIRQSAILLIQEALNDYNTNPEVY